MVVLWGFLLMKYGVIFGGELAWWAYAGGSIAYLLIPVGVGRVAWALTGKRPYWGDNAFIGAGAVLFVLLSIPAYAIGLGG
jgi:hypothetical protein